MVIHQGVSLMSTYEIPGGVIASQGEYKSHFSSLPNFQTNFKQVYEIKCLQCNGSLPGTRDQLKLLPRKQNFENEMRQNNFWKK